MTEEQFQEQLKARLDLIDQLLTCSSGEEQAILHANSQLLDAAFVKTMELVAAKMVEDGEKNAKWLQGLANELAEMMEAKEKLDVQVMELYNAGKYDEAIPIAEQGVTLARQLWGESHAEVATNLNNLTLLYESQGRHSEAEPLYKQAIEIHKVALPANHPSLATNLNNLANLYRAQGRYSEAEPLYKQAIEIFKIALPANHPSLATNLNNLAGLYESQGRYSEAEPLFKKAIEIDNIALPANHPSLATDLNNLAGLYSSQGRYSEAEPLYKQAIEIDKIALPANHPDLATHLNNLAGLYKSQGRYSEAEPLYKQAIEIHKVALPANHPQRASGLNNLAGLYRAQGRYSEAEPLLKQAIEIYKVALPANHPFLATNLNNLAELYRAQGRYSEAEPLYKQAIEVDKIALPANHPSLATNLNNLAELYHAQGRYSEAEPLYKQAIEIHKVALPANHPQRASCLNNLALLYASQGRYSEALKLMLKASKIEDKTIQAIFASSSESDRLAHIKQEVRPNLETFLSLVYQHFPHSPEAKQAALNLVLKRKSLTATAMAAQNQAVFSGRYPQLQEIFPQWRRKCDQLLTLTYEVPRPEKRETHKQQLAQLQKECNELERKLTQQMPEIEIQQQMGDIRAVASELSEGEKLLEFVQFDVYDVQEKSWGKARYLAFVLAGGKPSEVEMIDLGEAENIDRLISTYRNSVIKWPLPQQMNMWNNKPNSTETETPTKHYIYDSQPGKELREAVFDKLRDKLTGCSHLVLAPDGDLNLVPFQILPEDDGKTTLQDEYNISYVSVGRELLRRRIKTKPTANPPLIMADPNFDWPQNAPDMAQQKESPAVSGLNVQPMLGTLAGITFPRVKATADLAKTIGQQLGVKPFLGNEATADRLLKCQSPKQLIVATHGYYSQRKDKYLTLLKELLSSSQGKEVEILEKNYGLLDEEFLAFIERYRNSENRDNKIREKLRAIAPLVKQQLKTTPVKPPVNNMDFETFKPNRHQAKIENPMMGSAVAFTGANTWLSGGQLPPEFPTMAFAQDIAGLDLWETELVILIACESGLGDVQTGEGVFGLRRAFAVAGNQTLIMSLWSVPTLATMLLMEQFLDDSRSGMSAGAALRKAQKYIRNITVGELQKSKLGSDILGELNLGKNLKIESKPLAHPYFWGAWICQSVSELGIRF